MFLDIGNIDRINDPSAEQIGYHLRNLPKQSPFLILDADEELYIQATPTGSEYRVELRQGKMQRYAILSLDQVEELFQAFRRWDEPAIQAVTWHRLSIWTDPFSKTALCIVLCAAIVLALWSPIRQLLFGRP